MIKDVVQGSGSFHVTVRLLNGTMALPENYTLSPDEEVVVEVSVNSTLSQIKVVLNRCWATPTNNPAGPVEYIFLENGYVCLFHVYHTWKARPLCFLMLYCSSPITMIYVVLFHKSLSAKSHVLWS